jgi:hypothetical protein
MAGEFIMAGRPKIEIPLPQLKALMRLNPTLKDTAAFFECSEDTIINKLEEFTGSRDFSAFREQNLVHTRMTLIRNALKMAEKGNAALMIFCLKNLCKWQDKWETEVTTSTDPEKKLVINFSGK